MPELPVPQVTIVDPHRPADQSDLLTPGPGWRPSRRLVAGVGALLFVLGVGAAATASVVRHQRDDRQRAEQRRLDRAAVAALSVALVDPSITAETTVGMVRVALRNDSGAPVTVVRARIDGPGFLVQPVHVQLDRDAQADLELPLTPRCAPTLQDGGPARLLLDVATVRGTVGHLAVPLIDGEYGTPVTQAARQQCGILPLEQSLVSGDVQVVSAGSARLELDYALGNAGTLPADIVAVTGRPGFRAITAGGALPTDPPGRTRTLPMRLPISRAPEQTLVADVALRVVLAADCPFWRSGKRPAAGDGDGLRPVDLVLSRGARRATLALDTYGEPASPLQQALHALVAGCGR